MLKKLISGITPLYDNQQTYLELDALKVFPE